jgi:hypothetical protein
MSSESVLYEVTVDLFIEDAIFTTDRLFANHCDAVVYAEDMKLKLKDHQVMIQISTIIRKWFHTSSCHTIFQ